ncbi:MAG TPA: response regulator [Chroococcales cyanobacterium]
MRILIVEDDFTSRRLLQKILAPYGECEIAINGKEAVSAVELAWGEDAPYHLICLDIMMPEMDGQETLGRIRAIEKEKGVNLGSEQSSKIVMTTSLADPENFFGAFRKGCETYVIKPIERKKLLDELQKLDLIN